MGKIVKNFLSGVIGQLATIFIGFIIPRLILTSYGSNINGLLSSTSQLFEYIALLEAGVGTATLQALYFPVANDNKKDINRILSATNYYYKRTGLVYFLCVILLSFGYPLVVHTEIETGVVIIVILAQGLTGVVNYLFQGKYRLLLQAEGKNYILTNIATIIQITVGLCKALVISLGYNVIAVQTVSLLINLCQTVYIICYIKKKYKWICLKEKPNFKAISQKNDVLVSHISALVYNNTDILLLTLFTNLNTVSVYSVYLMLCNMVNTVIDNISASMTYKFGYIFNTDIALFIRMQKQFEKYYLALVFWFYTSVYVFIIPFLKIYTKGVNDANYLDVGLSILFVVMQILSYCKRPFNQVINLTQKFKETKWRCVAEAIINLTVSLVLVQKMGIYGVLLGSIVAVIYRLMDLMIYTNKVLETRIVPSFLCVFVDVVILFLIVSIMKLFVIECESYLKLFSYATVFTVVSGVLYFGINTLMNLKESKFFLTKIMHYLREKE